VLADVTGDGRLNSTDATRILQQAVGMPRPEFPALPPDPPTLFASGPDPLLSIPKTFTGRPGEMLTVPVLLDLPEGLHAVDLALAYDTSRLEILSEGDVRRGTLTAGFELFQINLDAAAGTFRVGLASLRTGGLPEQSAGSVLEITFRIKAGASAGPAVINLLHELTPMRTQLNEGGLVLFPVPRNAAGDVLDGLITVRSTPMPTVQTLVIIGSSEQRSQAVGMLVTLGKVVHSPGHLIDGYRAIDAQGFVRKQGATALDETRTRAKARLLFPVLDPVDDSRRYTLTIAGNTLQSDLGRAAAGDGTFDSDRIFDNKPMALQFQLAAFERFHILR
jgi:hypothetical protein